MTSKQRYAIRKFPLLSDWYYGKGATAPSLPIDGYVLRVGLIQHKREVGVSVAVGREP